MLAQMRNGECQLTGDRLEQQQSVIVALSPSAEIPIFITNFGVYLYSLLNERCYFWKNVSDYLSVHQLVSLNSLVPIKKIHTSVFF